MRRTPLSTLVLTAVVAAVAGFVTTDHFFGDLPPVGWASVTLYAIAVIDLVLALRIRSAISGKGIGHDRSQLHPISVVRALALGQASGLLGAVAAGAGAGLAVFMAVHAEEWSAARADLIPSISVLTGGLLLAAAGLLLEHCCQTPPGDDEVDRLAQPT